MILLSCSFVAMACSCRAASSGCIFTDGVIELIIPIQLARPMTSVASLPSRKRRGRRELVVAFDWFPLGFRRLRSPPFGQLKHLRRKNKNIFNFSKKKGEKMAVTVEMKLGPSEAKELGWWGGGTRPGRGNRMKGEGKKKRKAMLWTLWRPGKSGEKIQQQQQHDPWRCIDRNILRQGLKARPGKEMYRKIK